MDDFIEIYENAVPEKVCEHFIKFFEEQDRFGKTWAGTMGGLVEFDKATGNMVFYNKTNSGLPQNEINDIIIDNKYTWIFIGSMLISLALTSRKYYI